jgi:UDP-N-acetylmuramoyl-tripeptide--D-alanyl-D-alanine ligase
MRMHAADVARITGGLLIGPDVVADGISFDSRTLVEGQCFVALVADRDGHEYVADAYAAGSPLCLVHRGAIVDDRLPQGCARVEVHDTMSALSLLGLWARENLDRHASGRVIGVTGSAGKTSTKDFIAAVLNASCTHPYASEMSFNNDIGVPATMMNAPDECDAIVLEMGMRGFGEITRLCEMARPVVGVITSIGEAHSERVGGIEGVARAKGELLLALPATGTAIVSADDPRAVRAATESPAQKLTFGTGRTADVRYEIQTVEDDGRVTMSVHYKELQKIVTVPLPGQHMASNATAAIAVGVAIGLDFVTSVEAISRAVVSGMRMQWVRTQNDVRVINDAYNANPDSMIAALNTLASVHAVRRVAILGVMAEIADTRARHEFVAQHAQGLGIDLWAVGTDLYGVDSMTIDDATERVASLDPGDVVLLKGSRVAGLERVLQLLGVAPPR